MSKYSMASPGTQLLRNIDTKGAHHIITVDSVQSIESSCAFRCGWWMGCALLFATVVLLYVALWAIVQYGIAGGE